MTDYNVLREVYDAKSRRRTDERKRMERNGTELDERNRAERRRGMMESIRVFPLFFFFFADSTLSLLCIKRIDDRQSGGTISNWLGAMTPR